jgi:hypothetical protein
MFNTKVLLLSVVLIVMGVQAGVPKAHGINPLMQNPNSVDMKCTLKNCAMKMAKAMVDPTFMEQAWCQNTCTPFYYNDTTPMKLHYQNCTPKCALTYEDNAGDEFLACAIDYNCVQFAPIENTCPKPEVDPEASLASLDGEWW